MSLARLREMNEAAKMGVSFSDEERREYHGLVSRLIKPGDEAEILATLDVSLARVVSARVAPGRFIYGPDDINDGRDDIEETWQEVVDALYYAARGLTKLRRVAARARLDTITDDARAGGAG